MTIQRPSSAGSPPEKSGPYPGYDAMMREIPPSHPMRFVEAENLFWYDGPICSIGFVPGDERPRLDVVVDQYHEGGDGLRVFTETRHQLVFADRATLDAGIHRGMAPTRRSYEDALGILRYTSVATQIGHPRPSAEVVVQTVAMTDVEEEMPDADLLPEPPASEDAARG